jgi:hypothetical protein
MKKIGRRGVAVLAVAVLLCAGCFAIYRVATQPHWYGTPNPTDLPEGGISKEMAIDIALRSLGDVKMPPEADIGAGAMRDTEPGRWVWDVYYGAMAGPTSGWGYLVVIDFFSGEVLDTSQWVA